MPSKTAPKKRAAPKKAVKKAIPPQRATTPKVVDQTKVKDRQVGGKTSSLVEIMAKAESDKLTLQTEAAIKLAIGYVMHRCGERAMTITADGLKQFAKLHKVEVSDRGGAYTYAVLGRT